MTNQASAPSGDPIPVAFLRRRRFARASAIRFLYQADVSGQWELDPARFESFWSQITGLDDTLTEKEFQEAMTFAGRLIRGVISRRAELDARISASADNWSLDRMSIVDRNILRLALFEMLDEETRTPPVAAIDEAIELAKEFGDKHSGRFVNGILDRVLGEMPRE